MDAADLVVTLLALAIGTMLILEGTATARTAMIAAGVVVVAVIGVPQLLIDLHRRNRG